MLCNESFFSHLSILMQLFIAANIAIVILNKTIDALNEMF